MKIKPVVLFLAFTLLSVFNAGMVLATPVDNVTIDEVTFSGSKYDVYRDTGAQTVYESPQWKLNRNFQSPVCYLRNTKATVSAVLKVTPANATDKVKIKGTAGDNVFGVTEITPASGQVSYPSKASSQNLPNTIRPGNSFSIHWQWSKDNGQTWNDAGWSGNQMYVLLAAPQSTLYHTVVDVSCSPNAGQTNTQTILTNIFSKYEGNQVQRVDDPHTLTYWKDGQFSAENFDTKSLLKDGDGRCGAWNKFLFDAYAAQGLGLSQVAITPINGEDATHYYQRAGMRIYSSLETQGRQASWNQFADHAVDRDIYFNLYDPSYGKKYIQYPYTALQQQWEDTSVDAFYTQTVDKATKLLVSQDWVADQKGQRETTFSQ